MSRIIRKKIEEIVKNIDKFEVSKDHTDVFCYKDIRIYYGSTFVTIYTTEDLRNKISLTEEENEYLFKGFEEKVHKAQNDLLNSITFKE